MIPTSRADILHTLRRVALFNDLSDAELALIAREVSTQRYDAGAIVFSEGDVCRDFLVVREGAVKILKTSPAGRQQLLRIERPGNSLSEVAVFDGGPYPETALALTATTLLRIDAAQFRRICLQTPGLALKVIKVLGYRLRQMGKLVEELSFSTVRGRLLAYLLRLAEETGHMSNGAVEFPLTENNEELAVRLGTVRELVSRNLGRLHGEGWIEMKRRIVRIPDLAAFRAEVAAAVERRD